MASNELVNERGGGEEKVREWVSEREGGGGRNSENVKSRVKLNGLLKGIFTKKLALYIGGGAWWEGNGAKSSSLLYFHKCIFL